MYNTSIGPKAPTSVPFALFPYIFIHTFYIAIFLSNVSLKCSHCRCTSPDEDPPTCDEEMAAVVQSNTYCGLIQDDSPNNPFRPCINAAGSNAEGFMENCEYDVCANQPDTDLMKEAACNSLYAFAAKCQDLGILVDWRSAAGCGKFNIIPLHK